MELKLERIKELIESIARDCKALEKKGQLTEKGKGQLIVVKLVEEILND